MLVKEFSGGILNNNGVLLHAGSVLLSFRGLLYIFMVTYLHPTLLILRLIEMVYCVLRIVDGAAIGRSVGVGIAVGVVAVALRTRPVEVGLGNEWHVLLLC